MKRFIIISFFTLICILKVFSQNVNLKYYSSYDDGDYSNKYEGLALAVYMSDEEYKKVESSLKSMGDNIDKLSKNNSWLCWKALSEWELKDGEKYFVFCVESKQSSDGIYIIATIKNNGKSFDWWGRYVTEDNVKVPN